MGSATRWAKRLEKAVVLGGRLGSPMVAWREFMGLGFRVVTFPVDNSVDSISRRFYH